ncbi:MAG: radical SAM protein, partial [Spirochaetaceae bacterium]|nr:radical SAM protein [Spirochaetaceae bacterium]
MNVTIITPPLVQLNSPYPSGAYLSAFFKECGHNAVWHDLSIELYYSIFSRTGLEKLFALSEKAALELAAKAEKQGDESTAFNIRRYISTKQSWINWIDDINAILCGKAREKEHQLLFSPYAPRGSRMEGFLSSLQHEPSVDDVRFLCTYALADLADYITAVFDHEFSLIRYAEHLTVDERDFAAVEKGLSSPVLENFYKPLLEAKFDGAPCPDLLCISIPFAGTFLSALYTARFFRQKYGSKVFISFGGGFVNTELRDAKDAKLGSYIDGISYDRGYGAYKSLFENSGAPQQIVQTSQPLYKFRLFRKAGVIEPLWQDEKMEQFEAELTAKIVPDYSDIDFSHYPRVCDDKNNMHRLWTDGAWIKAYLAHGCYWHKCAFCDTKLDYVCGYKSVDVARLYEGLLETAKSKNIYGIHFVDEALPPVSLMKFGLLNAQNGNSLYFWGNVRFEKAFTKDLAALLSWCGLGGVSAGLEVATGSGLESINKGTDVESIVSACAAFKEAGVLVHAYMIYGFWNDTPQTIIDSMETLRQFFAAGLLDSAFWHKFVLTRNS